MSESQEDGSVHNPAILGFSVNVASDRGHDDFSYSCSELDEKFEGGQLQHAQHLLQEKGHLQLFVNDTQWVHGTYKLMENVI